MSLDDYRIRHALYKSDAALQAVHAAFPWIVTWDDHETENNYAGFIPQDPVDLAIFADRRARAYQAYYEHMPLRRFSFPRGPHLQLYRRLSFGELLQVHVLDTRQYRSAEAIRTFGGEKWDGFPFDRAQVLDFIAAQRQYNTVVITGDVHQNFVRNVPPDYINLDAEPVATEFMGTSISSGGDRNLRTVFGGDANNPHLRLIDNHHGYVRCALSPEQYQADYRVVPSVLVEDAPISTLASFVVEQGRAGAQQA